MAKVDKNLTPKKTAKKGGRKTPSLPELPDYVYVYEEGCDIFGNADSEKYLMANTSPGDALNNNTQQESLIVGEYVFQRFVKVSRSIDVEDVF